MLIYPTFLPDQLYQLVSMCSLWGTETAARVTGVAPPDLASILSSLAPVSVSKLFLFGCLAIVLGSGRIAMRCMKRSKMHVTVGLRRIRNDLNQLGNAQINSSTMNSVHLALE